MSVKRVSMTGNRRYPSYLTCVADVLSRSPHPVSLESLLAAVADQRPLGKRARAAVNKALNQLFQVVPVGAGRYGWLSQLLTGAVIRHTLEQDEARRGFLLLDELEHIALFPQFFQDGPGARRQITIDLFGGPTLQVEMPAERKTWSLNLGGAFSSWLDEAGAGAKDDLLMRVLDADAGCYEFRLNLREMRDEEAIRNRNIRLALIAEDIVDESRGHPKGLPVWVLAARLLGRGVFREAPPADTFHYVLHEYSLLHLRNGVNYELVPSDRSNDRSQRRFALAFTQSQGDTPATAGLGQRAPSALQWGESAVKRTDYDPDPEEFAPDEDCETYQAYLEAFYAEQPGGEPVSHEDFHLLEAEMEGLVNLEQDFGRLLAEQRTRLEYLAALLFIDPDEFLAGEWDWSDGPDGAGPQFWTN